jgi:hypothetical protein
MHFDSIMLCRQSAEQQRRVRTCLRATVESRRLFAIILPSLALTLPLLLSGCDNGGDANRYHVSGTVTFNGNPVPQGSIQFLPDSVKGNEGPATNANIVDGRYDTTVSGRGTVGGAHIVVINGFDGQSRPEDELPFGKPLFTEYRTSVDLPQSTGETVNFEVQP